MSKCLECKKILGNEFICMCYNRNTLVYCVKCFKRMVGDIEELKKYTLIKENENMEQNENKDIDICTLDEDMFKKLFGERMLEKIKP